MVKREENKRGERNHLPASNATKGSQSKMENQGETAFLDQSQGAAVLVKAIEAMTAIMQKALGGMPNNNNRVWDNGPF